MITSGKRVFFKRVVLSTLSHPSFTVCISFNHLPCLPRSPLVHPLNPPPHFSGQHVRVFPFSLIHDPRNEYYKHYTVAYLGNVSGGYPIRYINVPIDVLRALTITTIDKDEPVWFGCDVGKSFHREKGLLQHNVFDFESAFGTGFGMDKRERLLYGESLMTHAMVITAYDREQLTSTWHGRLQRGVGLCCVVGGSGHSLVFFLFDVLVLVCVLF